VTINRAYARHLLDENAANAYRSATRSTAPAAVSNGPRLTESVGDACGNEAIGRPASGPRAS
jgi:hypothetical protein